MSIFEAIWQAISTILSNKLRSGLTLLSVALGVFAIFIAGSLSDSIDSTVENQLNDLGENVFMIKRMPSGGFGGRNWRKYRSRPRINLKELDLLKREVKSTKLISGFASDGGNVVQSIYTESPSDVTISGIDENYFMNYSRSIAEGRPISAGDLASNNQVAVIGPDVIKRVFPFSNPIGEKIRIQSQEFEIIGILEEKGAVLGNSQDNMVLLPLNLYIKYYSNRWESIDISVNALSQDKLQNTLGETIGAMRLIRNLSPVEDINFEIETNEALTEQFSGLRQTITIFGLLVGIFTLIAAGIGITNIMLITVKERTREIGVRKALGAKSRWVLYQFIIETITICQIGGLIGVLVAITLGKIFASQVDFTFVISGFWIIFAVIVTTLLGIVSGYYPSWKASKLNPIDALRYE
ncbi:ABC transporter permease [Candidatus Kapabacteria bacterium]|nr:ABC transporter permease [Candidatus Kapabacteria bacterium]